MLSSRLPISRREAGHAQTRCFLCLAKPIRWGSKVDAGNKGLPTTYIGCSLIYCLQVASEHIPAVIGAASPDHFLQTILAANQNQQMLKMTINKFSVFSKIFHMARVVVVFLKPVHANYIHQHVVFINMTPFYRTNAVSYTVSAQQRLASLSSKILPYSGRTVGRGLIGCTGWSRNF